LDLIISDCIFLWDTSNDDDDDDDDAGVILNQHSLPFVHSFDFFE